jgi:formylglycine-generating enzyme required for sulfatase activity
MPATGISWNEAARFVNWLNTSQGFRPAYKFATQPGEVAYVPNENISIWKSGDTGFDPENVFRNSQAYYFLPSADEWYKAAYYNPGNGAYFDYPNGRNTDPVAIPSGTGAATAIYGQPAEQGPADITKAGGLSPYKVMAMGGNVWEWEETEYDLVNDNSAAERGGRGGDFGAFFPDSCTPIFALGTSQRGRAA